ncbi:O-antigen ligase family protein [Austwickia chelonae]|uniref:O-antigen ligase family protein n=1 Tax=Austwickia chelonae TaxID=100225 RepID=UPI0013C2FF8B|nr:O-antigen ligase family protein [Austwickia chelonae]
MTTNNPVESAEDGRRSTELIGVRERLHRILSPLWAAGPTMIVVAGLLLTWISQISLRVKGLWLAPIGLLLLAVFVVTAACLWRLTWWRSRSVILWVAFWVAWAVSATVTWNTQPGATGKAARSELSLMAASAAITGAMILLSRGTRAGQYGFRTLWVLVLATTAPVAVMEILYDEHIVVTRWVEWYFQPHIPAGTFSNPNNYACVLVAVTGTLLAWSLDRVPRWVGVVFLATAGATTWLIWTTLSRGAVGAVALQLVVVSIGIAARRGWWAAVRRSRTARWVAISLASALGLLIAAAFLVPALADKNPLLRTPKAGEEESDGLRINLIRAGLRYWESSPLFGTGPGTFEYRLGQEKPVGIEDLTINAHNGFIEILSQYGLFVAIPFLALLAYCCRHTVGLHSTAADAEVVSRRVEIGCLLIALTVTGVVVSSSLALPMWFVMLAHVVTLSWRAETDRKERSQLTDESHISRQTEQTGVPG